MSVNLADYVADAITTVNIPGGDAFSAATSTDWLNTLRCAFWDLRLDGFLSCYTENADGESSGIITPMSPNIPDITRDMIQLVIFYAWKQSIMNQLSILTTSIKAVAGPVQFETQQSVQILRDVLKDIQDRANRLWRYLSNEGLIPIGYTDANFARDFGIGSHQTWWNR